MNKNTLILGIITSMFTVIIGAFGAHVLKNVLLENETLEAFDTAVQYQGMHGIALLITGVLSTHFDRKILSWTKYFFLIGVFFFSGSLYVLSVSGLKFLGVITPIGGVFFIIGWCLLLIAVYKKRDPIE